MDTWKLESNTIEYFVLSSTLFSLEGYLCTVFVILMRCSSQIVPEDFF